MPALQRLPSFCQNDPCIHTTKRNNNDILLGDSNFCVEARHANLRTLQRGGAGMALGVRVRMDFCQQVCVCAHARVFSLAHSLNGTPDAGVCHTIHPPPPHWGAAHGLEYAQSSMKGHRPTMEDAHQIQTDVPGTCVVLAILAAGRLVVRTEIRGRATQEGRQPTVVSRFVCLFFFASCRETCRAPKDRILRLP